MTLSLWDLNLLVCPSGRVNPCLVCVPAKAKLQISASSCPFSHIKNIFYVNKYLFTTAFSKVHSILLMNMTFKHPLPLDISGGFALCVYVFYYYNQFCNKYYSC